MTHLFGLDVTYKSDDATVRTAERRLGLIGAVVFILIACLVSGCWIAPEAEQLAAQWRWDNIAGRSVPLGTVFDPATYREVECEDAGCVFTCSEEDAALMGFDPRRRVLPWEGDGRCFPVTVRKWRGWFPSPGFWMGAADHDRTRVAPDGQYVRVLNLYAPWWFGDDANAFAEAFEGRLFRFAYATPGADEPAVMQAVGWATLPARLVDGTTHGASSVLTVRAGAYALVFKPPPEGSLWRDWTGLRQVGVVPEWQRR